MGLVNKGKSDMNYRGIIHKFILLATTILLSGSIVAQSDALPNIFSFDWSDDGSRFATVSRTELTIYEELLNPIANEVFPEEIGFELPSINLNTNGTRIYVGNSSEKRVLDSTTLQSLVSFSDESIAYWSSQWNSDSSEIAFRTQGGRSTVIYDAANGNLLRTFSTPIWGYGYFNLRGFPIWSPDDRYFAGVINRDTVIVLDAMTGQEVVQYQVEDEDIIDIVWNPDPTTLRLALVTSTNVVPGSPGSFPDAYGDDHIRNSVFFVDALSGTVISSVTGLRDYIFNTAWHPNGIEFSGNDERLRLYTWNANTGELIDSYLTKPYRIELFDYSPYGGRLVLGYKIGEQSSARTDDNFVPITTYSQVSLTGAVEFVAPAASSEKLQSTLSLCATDPSTAATGNAFLASEQYGEFVQWLNQQVGNTISLVCAHDLQLGVETIFQANTY